MKFQNFQTRHLFNSIFWIVLVFTNCTSSSGQLKNQKKITGVNIVAPVKKTPRKAFSSPKEIGVNSVSLIPYAFVNIKKNKVIFKHPHQWWGETPQGISQCIEDAYSYGLTVMIKPHLWIGYNKFTGDLSFNSKKQWTTFESSYRDYILEFAQIASAYNVEYFCIGTELKTFIKKRPLFWKNLIQEIKSLYKGKLTYAANWDEFEQIDIWKELDYIGIDAYFPLSSKKQPSLDQLKKSWSKYVKKIALVSKNYNKEVVFTEYGYRNSQFNTAKPWEEKNTVQNNRNQTLAYQALLETFYPLKWFHGGYCWKWFISEKYKQITIGFTPQNNKETLNTIKLHYLKNQ